MELIEAVKQFGEPGFIWADDTESTFNPCVEINLYPKDPETGASGWAFCNLCEINGKKIRPKMTGTEQQKPRLLLEHVKQLTLILTTLVLFPRGLQKKKLFLVCLSQA